MSAHASALAYSIRPATAVDLDALLALERASFTTDHLSRRQYQKHLHSPSATVLAAVDAHGLLGKAVVFFRRNSDVARLYSIAVDGRARGRGVGEALLHAVARAARQRARTQLHPGVRPDNAGDIRLYERMGYCRFAARAGFYEDGADAWRYEKKLA